MPAGHTHDVVWWSKTGSVLHRNPDCPPFVRARARSMREIEAGDFSAVDRIRSYDFRESTMVSDPYPPQRLTLCRVCAD